MGLCSPRKAPSGQFFQQVAVDETRCQPTRDPSTTTCSVPHRSTQAPTHCSQAGKACPLLCCPQENVMEGIWPRPLHPNNPSAVLAVLTGGFAGYNAQGKTQFYQPCHAWKWPGTQAEEALCAFPSSHGGAQLPPSCAPSPAITQPNSCIQSFVEETVSFDLLIFDHLI